MDSADHLRNRIAQLDSVLGGPEAPAGADPDLVRFIWVMELVNSNGPTGDSTRLPRLSPAVADTLVDSCRLLSRLEARAPDLVRGPLGAGPQYWTAVGKPPHLPPVERRLSQHAFIAVESIPSLPTIAASTKPFGFGLHTSSGGLAPLGMWRTFLQLQNGSSLYPLPWSTWQATVSANASVREIASAADWASFVQEFPRRQGHLLYPDWRAVGRRHDGVHMCLRGIVAAQGIELLMGDAVVAAPYWDVESTFWLRWRLEDPVLVPAGSGGTTYLSR